MGNASRASLRPPHEGLESHDFRQKLTNRDQSLGKYADTAIPEMIRQMMALARVAKLSLTAKIAGGANMFSHISRNPTNTIGDQNIVAVEQALAVCQIPILARNLGGTFGRRMVVDVENGAVQIHIIGQPVIQL